MNVPDDWEHPEWDVEWRVHNWRNYTTQELRDHWSNMTDATKKIVAAALDEIADREDWD